MPTEREVERAFGDLGELLARHEGEQSARTFGEHADDPVGFIRDVLNGRPWAMQKRIAEAVRDHPQVSVRSCHAAGKDWLAARLALWWTYARQGLVVLTGPTATQVEEILMRGEVREAFRRAGLPGELHVRALRPGGEGKAGILAKTATGVSALTGFHDAQVLFCITEAQDRDIGHAWDAAFACTTGAEDRILTLGNPTERSGRFYRAHQGGSGWKAFRVAASDIPNVREGETVVPGLLTREGVDRFAREYGEESGFYQSRVHAEFPAESEEGLFRRDWLEAAAERRESGEFAGHAEEATPVAALDPARYGPDASVLAVRRGPVLEAIEVWEGEASTSTLVERVQGALGRHGIESSRVQGGRRLGRRRSSGGGPTGRVIVDEVGLGAGVQDRLSELGYSARGFNGGKQAQDPERFFNRRAEVYWTLRKKLEDGVIALPRDEALFEELLALRWRPTPQGKVQLERKEDLRSRLGRSPDRADAVAMVFTERQTTPLVWGSSVGLQSF